MRLIVLSKMFNEQDFLPIFVQHYVDQGCDAILIVDHGSTDGSAELAAKLPHCQLIAPPNVSLTRYTYAIDQCLCNYLLDYARSHTTERTWWLFPDVDELLYPGPGFHGSLRDYLTPLTDVNGVGCIGIHCLPLDPCTRELESLTAEEWLARRDEFFPPRRFEMPPRAGEAWKNIVWQFWNSEPEQFRGLTFSVGSHVLLGQNQLQMHGTCLASSHYKVRSLARYCDRTRKVLDRIPVSDTFRQVVGEKLTIVENWTKNNGRLLRLGTRLSTAQILAEMKRTHGQGVYLETPYPERPGPTVGGPCQSPAKHKFR